MDTKTLNTHLENFLGKLGFKKSDFISYVICGRKTLSLSSQKILIKLDTCKNLKCFMRYLQNCETVLEQRSNQVTENVFIDILQELFLCCLIILLTYLQIREKDLDVKFTNINQTIWNFYLTQPFCQAFQIFLKHMQIHVIYPPIQIHVKPVFMGISEICEKTKSDLQIKKISLSVLSPSNRKEIKSNFLQRKINNDSEHDLALQSSLYKYSSEIPCGSPFDEMIKALSFNSIIKCKQALFSLENNALSYEVFKKTLAYNILSSIISLPLICKRVIIAGIEKAQVSQKIVICVNCGHCLNFGRGKFKKTNFKPTHLFYCRDQREKQFTVCANSGRIYCSYCGCADIKIIPMIYAVKEQLYIRAVVANNAAVTLNCFDQELSILVPCLANTECTTCILKKLTILDIIYLTSSIDNFYCLKCNNIKL